MKFRSHLVIRPKFWRSEKGQSLAVLALAMATLLAMSALLVDGGMAYTQRRAAQNAADAGAMAGARVLALGGGNAEVIAAVTEYTNARNGALFSFQYFPAGTAPGNGAKGVSVTARKRFDTTFAQFLGIRDILVTAPAVASFGSPRQPGPNVQPLARRCDGDNWEDCLDDFEYGEEYEIWQGEGPGNFGWLSWNGSPSASYVAEELTPGHQMQYVDPHGTCSQVERGCWVQGAPGLTASERSALETWLAPGMTMTVIVYDDTEGQGSSANYRVAGFAAFQLTSFDLTGVGNDQMIKGRFLQWVTAAPVDDGGPNFGLVGVHLRNP